MGIVNKAKDIKLDRAVALKFLSPGTSQNKDTNKRFIQEAKAASGLDQTNICTIYEIGETDDKQMLIVMPFSIEKALRIKPVKSPSELNTS